MLFIFFSWLNGYPDDTTANLCARIRNVNNQIGLYNLDCTAADGYYCEIS
jgi:hypothetical protein